MKRPVVLYVVPTMRAVLSGGLYCSVALPILYSALLRQEGSIKPNLTNSVPTFEDVQYILLVSVYRN